MTVITWKNDQLWPVHNTSWPNGRFSMEHDPKKDAYIIKTETGRIVAEVGPTLLAAAIVETNNRCLDEYDASKVVHP